MLNKNRSVRRKAIASIFTAVNLTLISGGLVSCAGEEEKPPVQTQQQQNSQYNNQNNEKPVNSDKDDDKDEDKKDDDDKDDDKDDEKN